MLKFIKRLQLERKGLSCGKTRRKSSESEWVETLRSSEGVKAFVFGTFFVVLLLLIYYSPAREDSAFGNEWMKSSVVACFVFVASLVQFYANHPVNFLHNGRIVLVFGSILLQLTLLVGVQAVVNTTSLYDEYVFILMPYGVAALAISALLGRRLGMFTVVFSSIWGCFLVENDTLLEFFVVSLLCGFVGIYATHKMRRRTQLIRAGLLVGVTTLVLLVVLGKISFELIFTSNWNLFAIQSGVALLVGLFTAAIVGGLLPIVESAFRITTDMSWIELTDMNHPLMKRLTIEAPGTYHHSLVVAQLSYRAAEEIGANATMCRACAYFHDIGKLSKPGYFIENIQGDNNPHDELTPTMSALVIMAHVKDGVDLAVKNNLNTEIIEVIREHHGTSMAYYFYRRALDQQDKFKEEVEKGNANEEDIPEVDPASFSYPGPIPQTRESAIISLADAVESASRSLQKPTPGKIKQLIDEIVASRIKEGQLSECHLTLCELSIIKKSFGSALQSMLHSRVAYPKEKEAKEKEAA